MLTSKELELIQETLKKSIRASLSKLDCDYDKVKELAEVTGKVDTLRRQTRHDEKFGVYEDIVDEVIEEFNSDDIPF